MPSAAPTRRVTHASGLRAVERELAGMHREMLRATSVDAGPVRLAALNLVAACADQRSVDSATTAIAAISEHHPLRAITVLAHPGAEAAIEADVALHCSVSGRGQVCAEQVHLVVNGEPAYHLAGVVAPLLVPDKPVFLWLVGSPPVRQALSSDAVAICERLILDSGAYDDAAATLMQLAAELRDTDDGLDVADFAWERIHDWRALIASCFEGDGLNGFQRSICAVEVESCGAAPSTQPWLLVGWLGSRLEWNAGPDLHVASRRVDDVGVNDLTRVVLRCRRDDTDATVSCERRGDTLTASIELGDGPTIQRAVPFNPGDTVATVMRLLESAPHGRPWNHAVRCAARLLEAHA